MIIPCVLEILKIYLALPLCECESCNGLVNFSIKILEKDKIVNQSTTRHKYVSVIVKVTLVVEVNLFHMSPNFLIEDEYILCYIKIVCGMCGVLMWYKKYLNFVIVVPVVSWSHVKTCSNKEKYHTYIVNEHVTHATNI